MHSRLASRPLRWLNKCATLLTFLLVLVTVLTPTFTLVPIYLAVRAFSVNASSGDGASGFLRSYAQYLNELASEDESEMTFVFCCTETTYYGWSSKDSAIAVGPAPVYSIVITGRGISVQPQWGNDRGLIVSNASMKASLSAPLTASVADAEANSETHKNSLERVARRLWWPPIEAVRMVYVTVCFAAVAVGLLALALSGFYRKQQRKISLELLGIQ